MRSLVCEVNAVVRRRLYGVTVRLDQGCDAVPGSIAYIVMLRISYVICRKIIDPVILDECRKRATRFLDAGSANKLRFVAALIMVWGFMLYLFVKYLVHIIGKL